MSHVVMHAASFTTLAAARRAEAELRRLTRAYIAFEAEDPDPWRDDRVAPPLVDFGRTHGIDWPHRQDARFLLKGSFADSAEVLLVDRLVFFWGGGFELGGPALRAVLVRLGATVTTDRCDVSIRTPHADARVRELADFLVDEDFEGQFRLDDDGDATPLHRLTLVGPAARRVFTFDDSGVQDWAFVALLPQLDGEALELAVLAPSSR